MEYIKPHARPTQKEQSRCHMQNKRNNNNNNTHIPACIQSQCDWGETCNRPFPPDDPVLSVPSSQHLPVCSMDKHKDTNINQACGGLETTAETAPDITAEAGVGDCHPIVTEGMQA